MESIEFDTDPLSGLVYNTPTTHPSAIIACITEPTSYTFLPSGICTKETSFVTTISQPQEAQTPPVEHELLYAHTLISEDPTTDAWNPYTPPRQCASEGVFEAPTGEPTQDSL